MESKLLLNEEEWAVMEVMRCNEMEVMGSNGSNVRLYVVMKQ